MRFIHLTPIEDGAPKRLCARADAITHIEDVGHKRVVWMGGCFWWVSETIDEVLRLVEEAANGN